jgi:hypothetical protein
MQTNFNHSYQNHSFLMTPQSFLNLYTKIYNFDEDIATVKSVAFILNMGFLSIGILANMISIFVLFQKKLLKHKFNWYLLIVGIFKLVFCITLFIDYLFSKCYKDPIFLHDLDEMSSKILDFIVHTSDSCVVFLTIFLSLDRLYAIKKPMRIKQFITNLHAIYVISITVFILILLKSLSICFCSFDIGINTRLIFCTIISPTLFNTIPLIIVLVLNTLLIIYIIRYYRSQARNTEFEVETAVTIVNSKDIKSKVSINSKDLKSRVSINSKDLKSKASINNSAERRISVFNRNRRISKIQKSHYFVIMISDIYSILTSLPYFALNTYFILFQLSIFNMETIVTLQIISSILFNSNHSIDFFIYLTFYSDFRNGFIYLFTRKSLTEL